MAQAAANIRRWIRPAGAVALVVIVAVVVGLAMSGRGRSKASPNTPPATHERCPELVKVADPEKTLQEAATRIAADPTDAGAYSIRGGAHAQMGNLKEAAEALQGSTALDPDCAPSQRALGQVLTDLGQFDAALAALDKALALDGDDRAALLARGVAKGRSGDLAGAIEDLDKLIALEPASFAAHFNRGIALLQAERFEDAAGALEKAIEIDGSVGAAHLSLGQALAKLGRTEESARAIARAAELGVGPDGKPVVGPATPSTAAPTTTPTTAASTTTSSPPQTTTTLADGNQLLLTTEQVTGIVPKAGSSSDGAPPTVPSLCEGTLDIAATGVGRRWKGVAEGVWVLRSSEGADQAFAQVDKSAKTGCLWKLDDGSVLELDGTFVVRTGRGRAVGFAIKGVGGKRGDFSALGAVVVRNGVLAYIEMEDATLDSGVEPLRRLATAAADRLG